MYKKLGIQLYTIRDFMKTEEDMRRSFARLKDIGYDQVQTAGCFVPFKEFGEIAREYDLEIVGTHDDFERMQTDLAGSVEDHKKLGTRIMGTGGCPKPQTVEEVENIIGICNTIASGVKPHGFKFSYHNHSFEFLKIDGKTVFQRFLESFDENISFVLDTYWAQYGGMDVRSLMGKMRGRIDILHLKDMAVSGNNPYITECGNGNINFEEIIPLAEEIGVSYLVVEQDTCPGDPFVSAEISSKYLHKYFIG